MASAAGDPPGPIRESHTWHRDGHEHTWCRTVSRQSSALNNNNHTIHHEEIRHDIHDAAQRQHHVQTKSQKVAVKHDGLTVHITWLTEFERALRSNPADAHMLGTSTTVAQEQWESEFALDLRPLLNGSGAPIESFPLPHQPPVNVQPPPATPKSSTQPPIQLRLTAPEPCSSRKPVKKVTSQPIFSIEEVSSDQESATGDYDEGSANQDSEDEDALFVPQRKATATSSGRSRRHKSTFADQDSDDENSLFVPQRKATTSTSSRRHKPPSSTKRARRSKSAVVDLTRDNPDLDVHALNQRIQLLERQLSEKSSRSKVHDDGQDGGGREKRRKRGGASEKRRKASASWATDGE